LKPTLLPIDECEEWIWDILDSTKDCGFEYLADESRDFLIFNYNEKRGVELEFGLKKSNVRGQ
jgi:hypothetical protein